MTRRGSEYEAVSAITNVLAVKEMALVSGVVIEALVCEVTLHIGTLVETLDLRVNDAIHARVQKHVQGN